MTVRDTSLAAYRSLDLNLGHERVLSAFDRGAKLTREQIAQRTGMKLQTVCGRVNELLHRFTPAKLEELPAENGAHPLKLPGSTADKSLVHGPHRIHSTPAEACEDWTPPSDMKVGDRFMDQGELVEVTRIFPDRWGSATITGVTVRVVKEVRR